ncbi:MAG: hypothetical protein IJE17_07905 [Clostridia bacterium]|nr:hypothetical protein [Clostridia bacterium]
MKKKVPLALSQRKLALDFSGRHTIRLNASAEIKNQETDPLCFLHIFPLSHWHTRRLNAILKYPEPVFGRVREGIQEQTRRVCDAASAIIAEARSIRKRSAGYAIRSKPGGFVTRQAPSLLKQGAYASAAQGMRCFSKASSRKYPVIPRLQFP